MEECLLSLGLIKKNVPKDSVCLFRAVAEQVYFSQSFYQYVREKVTKFIEANEAKFKAIINDMDVAKYVKTLKETASWGTQIDMIAVSLIYRKDILVYIPSERMPIKMTNNRFDDYITLCTTNWNHYDCVYPQHHFKSSAFIQSMLYDVLYRGVFGIYFEYDKQFETQLDGVSNDLVTYSDKVKISSNDSTSNGLDEQYEKYTESSSPEYNKIQRKFRYDTYCYKANRRESFLKKLAKNIPVSLKILKSLDVYIFRNVAYDAWFEAKKDEQKINLSAVVNYQYAPGDVCLVKLKPTNFFCSNKNAQILDHFYNAHIQHIKGGNKEVVVFVEDLGQKFEVKVEQLYPFPGHMGILSPNNFYGKFGGKIQSNFFNEVSFNSNKSNHKKLNHKKSRFKHEGTVYDTLHNCINPQELPYAPLNEIKLPSPERVNYANNFCDNSEKNIYMNDAGKVFPLSSPLDNFDENESTKRKEEIFPKYAYNETKSDVENIFRPDLHDEKASGIIRISRVNNTKLPPYNDEPHSNGISKSHGHVTVTANHNDEYSGNWVVNGHAPTLNHSSSDSKEAPHDSLSYGSSKGRKHNENLSFGSNTTPDLGYHSVEPHYHLMPPPSMYFSPHHQHIAQNYNFANVKQMMFNNHLIHSNVPTYQAPHPTNSQALFPTQSMNSNAAVPLNMNADTRQLIDSVPNSFEKSRQDHNLLNHANVMNVNAMYHHNAHLPFDGYPSVLPPPPPGTTWVPLIFVNHNPENLPYDNSLPAKHSKQLGDKLTYDVKTPNSPPKSPNFALNDALKFHGYSNGADLNKQLDQMNLNNEISDKIPCPKAGYSQIMSRTLNPPDPINICNSTNLIDAKEICSPNLRSKYPVYNQENYKEQHPELMTNASMFKLKKKKTTNFRVNNNFSKDDFTN